MDFIDAIRVLLRRWRVLVAGLVALAAASAAAVLLVPTSYQATGQVVLLLPSQATGAGTPTNPYLNLDPGLTVTASLIASSTSTKDVQRSVKAAGFTSDYTIGLDPGSGPILLVSAEDDNAVMAVRTRDEVIRRLQAELAQIQAAVNAPQRQLMQARPNNVPEVAEPLPGSKIRALAALGGVGGVTTLLVAFLRDRRLNGPPPAPRTPTKAAAPPPPPPAEAPAPAPAETPVVPSSVPAEWSSHEVHAEREEVVASSSSHRRATAATNGHNRQDEARAPEVQWWDA